MQRRTSVNAQGICGLLKLLLTGILLITSITLIITSFFLPTSGGLSLVLKGLAGAVYFTTLALTTSNILTFFLISLLILCFLLLDKLYNLITVLKVVALGPMNLEVQAITLPGFLSGSGFPAISARDSFLAWDLSFGLLAGTRRNLSFSGHHYFIYPVLTSLLALFYTC